MLRRSYRILAAVLLTVPVANPGDAQAPSFEPTPEEHVATVESAEQVGMALFVQYYAAREAQDLVTSKFGSDPAVGGWLVDFRPEGPRVRFVGGEGEEIRVLYQVDYLGRKPQAPVRHDPPARLEPGEDVLWKAKLVALETGSVCPDADYVAILVPLEMTARSGLEVYVLANSTPERAYLAGHAKVRVAYDGTVQEVEPLSKSCLALERPPGPEPAFVAGTHLLSSTPIATHVFTSLQIGKPLLIATDSGAWVVLGNRIHYQGSSPEEPSTEDPDLKKAWIRAPDGGWQPDGGEPASTPPWRERLIVWRASDDAETPWRDDERFRGQFADGYPDDLQVVFPPNPGEDRGEAMWVRVHAYHPESDRYLGMVLNQARWLAGITRGDNVEFSYEPQIGRPLAHLRDGTYGSLSLPPAALDGELAQLLEGVLHYREAAMGPHAADQFDACVETLARVEADRAGTFDEHHRYIAHYTLGRCLAETYQTDRAVEQFEKALELKPEALDPNVALLAELSLKVHEDKASEVLEARYLDQLALVRERYGDHERVATLLGMMFDRSKAGDLSDLTPVEIARRERVGFAAFRWRLP